MRPGEPETWFAPRSSGNLATFAWRAPPAPRREVARWKFFKADDHDVPGSRRSYRGEHERTVFLGVRLSNDLPEVCSNRACLDSLGSLVALIRSCDANTAGHVAELRQPRHLVALFDPLLIAWARRANRRTTEPYSHHPRWRPRAGSIGGPDIEVAPRGPEEGRTPPGHAPLPAILGGDSRDAGAEAMPFFWTQSTTAHGSIGGNRRGRQRASASQHAPLLDRATPRS